MTIATDEVTRGQLPAYRADDPRHVDRSAAPSRTWMHWPSLIALIVLYAWSLSLVEVSSLGEYGIVTILPITAFVAFLGVIVGLVLALASNRPGPLLGTYVTAFTVMIHGLPSFVYEHLRFSWAWKHVGVVEYITRNGAVDTAAPVHPVYHNWPGFFGLNAWITEAAGLESALSYASWAPILFDLLFLGALFVLFRSVSNDRRLIATGLMFFTLGNWVGQDYFAPQALAYFLYLVVIAIVLKWYSTEHGLAGARDDRYVALEEGSAESFVVALVLASCLLGIAVSHQITPVAMILVLVSLRLTRVIRVWWPAVLMVVFTASWALGPAWPFVNSNLAGVVNEFGGVDSNLETNLVATELFNDTQLRISQVARLLSALIAGLGFVGWLRRRRHRVSSRWLLVVAGAPVSLILLSSYGGEVLFRAYLFALPFAAFLAASIWFPTPYAYTRSFMPKLLMAAFVLLTSALLIADFGADNRQVFSDEEVAASEFLFANAPPGSLIVEGSRDYPRQHQNYEQFIYLPLDRSRPDTLDNLLLDPAARIAGWMSDTDRYSAGYVIITRSQRESVTALGTLLSPTLDRVESSLLSSTEFEVVFEAGDARIFAPIGQAR